MASRGIEREGIDPIVVERAEDEYRLETRKAGSIPDRVYRAVRERPLLLIHGIEAYRSPNEQEKKVRQRLGTEDQPYIALGLSLPKFDDSQAAKRVIYKVNLVEWRSLFEEEADDDEEAPVELT